MSFLTNPVKKDQCLFVTYTGRSSMSEMMSARLATNRYLSLKHWNKVVVDITALHTMPTTIEIINLASDLASDLPPDTRIALVAKPEQTLYVELFERVARIEGLKFRLFFDRAQAKAWARETAPIGQTKTPGTGAARKKSRVRRMICSTF